MKHVTFARAIAPYGVGDKRLVPDAVAAQLEKDGALSKIEQWPPVADRPRAGEAVLPVRKVLSTSRNAAAPDRRMAK